MEIQRKTTNFLHLGSFFATLTILFFLCYSYEVPHMRLLCIRLVAFGSF